MLDGNGFKAMPGSIPAPNTIIEKNENTEFNVVSNIYVILVRALSKKTHTLGGRGVKPAKKCHVSVEWPLTSS